MGDRWRSRTRAVALSIAITYFVLLVYGTVVISTGPGPHRALGIILFAVIQAVIASGVFMTYVWLGRRGPREPEESRFFPRKDDT